jgi:hypothetical protein
MPCETCNARSNNGHCHWTSTHITDSTASTGRRGAPRSRDIGALHLGISIVVFGIITTAVTVGAFGVHGGPIIIIIIIIVVVATTPGHTDLLVVGRRMVVSVGSTSTITQRRNSGSQTHHGNIRRRSNRTGRRQESSTALSTMVICGDRTRGRIVRGHGESIHRVKERSNELFQLLEFMTKSGKRNPRPNTHILV